MDNVKTYCLYDEKYYGKGYLIIQENEEEILRFMKLSVKNNYGFPHFIVHGYDKLANAKRESFHMAKISFSKEDNEDLYNAFLNISGKRLKTIDGFEQGKNNLHVTNHDEVMNIMLLQDVYGVREYTKFIDIDLGDEHSCQYYNELYDLYNNLRETVKEESSQEIINKVLKK